MNDRFDKKHLSEVERLIREIDKLYSDTGKKVARIGAAITQNGDSFSFTKSTQYKKLFNTVFSDMARGIEKTIINGVRAQWEQGEIKAIDSIADQLRGKISPLALSRLKEMRFASTHAAYEAFQKRMKEGLKLSERIWELTNNYKMNLELLINLEAGKSAHDIALQVQRFLKEPDNLFRRVRDELDNLKLSLPASTFHPGNGVYRSSYKNALRLARTEVNMAYRRAENARYQTLPFVVGFEVKLSNAHPVYDICDELKGKYPKDFIFSGWHPQCLCHTTAILATEAEYEALEEALLNGKPLPSSSKRTIKTPPKNFSDWVERNKERAATWKNQPYFIQDNFKNGKLVG